MTLYLQTILHCLFFFSEVRQCQTTKLCPKRADSVVGMREMSTGGAWRRIMKIPVNVSMRENHMRRNVVKYGYVHVLIIVQPKADFDLWIYLNTCIGSCFLKRNSEKYVNNWKTGFGFVIWATPWENLVMSYANNKGADQPAHPHGLISAFVVCCLDSIIPLVSISEISSLYLASVAEQAGLSLPWSQTLKPGSLVTRLICNICLACTIQAIWSSGSVTVMDVSLSMALRWRSDIAVGHRPLAL